MTKRTNNNRFIGWAIVFALLSAGLFGVYMAGGTVSMDESAFQLAQLIRMDWLTGFLRVVTNLGGGVWLAAMGVITASWMYIKGRRMDAALIVLTLIAAEMGNELLKEIVARPRPAGFHLIPLPDSYSFPSGHAMVGTAFYLMLAHMLSGWRRGRSGSSWIKPAASVLVLLIMVSRVYLGVHYFSDVLTGFCMSMVVYFIARTGYAGWVESRQDAVRPLSQSR